MARLTVSLGRFRTSRREAARHGQDERGMTMPELIISIVILGVIIVPLTAALTAFLKQGTDSVPVYESNIDARLVSTYLRRDITAAETIDGASLCGGSGTVVLSARWSDDVYADNLASYVVVTAGSGQRSLERRLCQNGTVALTTTLVGDLGANTPTYSCSPDCGAPDALTLDVRDGNDYRYSVTVDRRVQTT